MFMFDTTGESQTLACTLDLCLINDNRAIDGTYEAKVTLQPLMKYF